MIYFATSTNSLIDAIPCIGRSCYRNTIAINHTIAINEDEKIIKYDGKFWHEVNNNQSLVNNGSTYFSKEDTLGIAENLLYFDSGHSSRSKSSADSLCSNKGWRLASLAEIARNSATVGKVPHYIGKTWTNQETSQGYRYLYTATAYGHVYYWGHVGYVRCVK